MALMDESTARYMTRVQRIPRPSREEEAELARRHRAGDRRAGERLVNAHLQDVAFLALKLRNYGEPVSELIAEGNLGLLRALEGFDPERGTRFSTYATYWIRAQMIQFVLRHWRTVSGRAGVVRSRLFFRLRREHARLTALHGDREVVLRELAATLDLPEGRVAGLLERVETRDSSLDDASGGVPALLETLAADCDTEALYERAELHHAIAPRIETALSTLDARERFIAEQRLLCDDDQLPSLAEIGRHFGVSRERARQLEERTKSKLRTVFADAA